MDLGEQSEEGDGVHRGEQSTIDTYCVCRQHALAPSIFLASFSDLGCAHTEGWCGCRYLSPPTVHVGYVLALSIFLVLFGSLGCAHMKGSYALALSIFLVLLSSVRCAAVRTHEEQSSLCCAHTCIDKETTLWMYIDGRYCRSCSFLHCHQFQATGGQTKAQTRLCGARSGSPQLLVQRGGTEPQWSI